MNEVWKIWTLKGLSSKEIIGRMIFWGMILIALIIGAICFVNALKLVDRPFPGFLLNGRMVYGNVGQYYWTGTKAGLRYPDKVLTANGKVVPSPNDLKEVINRSKVGEPIAYTLERDGRILEIAVPVMRFSLLDFIVIFGVYFITGIIYLILAALVFFLKPHTKVSWAFFWVCIFLGIDFLTAFDLVSNYRFLHINIIVTSLQSAAALHLSFFFPEQKHFIRRFPRLYLGAYTISMLLALATVYSYPGPLYLGLYRLITLFSVIGVAALLLSVIHAYLKKTSSIARQRAKIVFTGAALAFPIPASVMLFTTFGVTFLLNNFFALPIILFPASIAYAIARHNLFDVDVYIKRAVGYGLMTAIVGAVYLILQVFVKTVILSPMFGEHAEKIYPILFALLVVFLFNPVNRKVQEGVDKLFYRKKFDYKDTIISVSNALTSVLNLDEIIKKIIQTVRTEMFIDKTGVILLDPKRNECQTLFIGDNPDSTSDNIRDGCIPYDDPLLALLTREKKLITEYDIAEDPRYADVRKACGQRFTEIGASLALPLVYQNEVKGMLALGHKKSGHFYTREDIHLLATLANQGAVAIENAKLADQMKKEETVRTNLSRYLSPQIVEQIVKNDVQVNLGGDRKTVTVLFSDIRNFTTITETRPPDQLVHILNEYFTEMAKIIFENQGSLDKYIGDAIVAVFGSLIAVDNHAKHAAQAAIQMMKRMPSLNEHWTKKFGFSMNIGIGINTGEVFLGNIGSQDRMEFTVIGDTVNVASRFSGLAKAGQILMTRETQTFIGHSDIEYNELPPSEVKGKSGKLEVFEILYSY